MIGQKELLKTIEAQILNGTFPRFSIIVGPRGAGKSLIAEFIADRLNASYVSLTDLKVDTVRDVIQQSYKCKSKVVYALHHADDISLSAKNALLKVIEEPPNNAMFVMTLEDEYNTLPTIRSRGSVYHTDVYTHAELLEYVSSYTKQQSELFTELCETPGEIQLLASVNVGEFHSYVCKVVDNIAKCSGPNAFKIGDDIKLKDTDEAPYDLKLFWKQFMLICLRRDIETNDERYLSAITITRDALNILRYRGVNKLMLFDKWILEIRGAWLD